MTVNKINLNEKFALFDEHWSPRVIGALNGQLVKLAKVQGEFVWHDHREEDELFLIIKGSLTIEFEENTVVLHPGEMCIVPKGVRHKPASDEEVWLMLFEPAATKHTGDVLDERTRNDQPWI